MNNLTWLLSQLVWVVLGLPVLIFVPSRPRVLANLTTAAATAWIAGKLLKDFFYTPRPFILSQTPPLVAPLLDGSFPSLHAAVSFSVAIGVFLYRPRAGAPLILLAGLVSLGRVLAGVHSPLDILGGLAIGLVCALTFCHSK